MPLNTISVKTLRSQALKKGVAWLRGIGKLPPRKLFILAILIVANVSLLVYFGFRKSQASVSLENQPEVTSLPAIQVVDDTGEKRFLTDLVGRVVMVQFVNPERSTEIEAFSKIFSKFGPSEVSFVLITRDARELRAQLPTLPENALVIEQNYADLKKTFHVPECCERRFIFDSRGKLSYHDYYYVADLNPRLNAIVKKDLPPLSGALLKALGSLNIQRFASLREQTRHSNSGKGVVVIFTSVSTVCPSGELVKLLNSYAARGSDTSSSFLAVVPKDYTNSDIENFKANLVIKFPVERANNEFSSEFGKVISSYGESRINNSVVFINRGQVSVLSSFDELNLKLAQL